MTMTMDDTTPNNMGKPGLELAAIRESRGLTREYVAGKLHLRVRLIELLEADSYEQMAGAVFVKGYIRAYAKLLGVPAEPYLEMLNQDGSVIERKTEKVALWQNKRQSVRSARWVTALIIVAALAGISFWWQKNNEGVPFFTNKKATSVTASAQQPQQQTTEMKVTDITKLQSLFRLAPQPVTTEKEGG